jgi:drug/metabolite transporter (DMT)-like permease
MFSLEARALWAAAGAGIQVGAAIVATRYVVHDVGPFSLGLLRYTVGVLCLAPFVIAYRHLRFAPRDLGAIIALGIAQFAILIILLNIGMQYVSSTRAALLFSTMPLLTMLVAALLGRESMTAPKVIGVLLTIAGVAATLGENLLIGTGRDEWAGIAAVLASALCGAVCSVLYRPYLTRYPTLPLAAVAMMSSVVFLAMIVPIEDFYTSLPVLPLRGWAAVLFIGVSSGTGYMLWLWALKHASPTHVTVFLSLSPVTAALLGVGLLGEALSPGLLLGMLGVATGLWAATRPGTTL